MNIKELTGNSIKKGCHATRASYRWHNKNTQGGNFGIDIYGLNTQVYELRGAYDKSGEITYLMFGLMYRPGIRIPDENLSTVIFKIKNLCSCHRKLEVKND